MRGIFRVLIVVLVTAIGTGTFMVGSASADNSHVEYVVEPQDGISVVQHGRSGLVEVEVVDCLTAGETFTFTMLVSSNRGGDSDLSVRKNSGIDISSWFTLDPEVVDLPSDGTEVVVGITPPAAAELDQRAVARIQEIGDPPAPGGHHGVKVKVSCVAILIPPVVIEPTPTPPPTPEVTPVPTPTPEIGQPAFATPTPQMPTELPDSGGEPPREDRGFITSDALPIGLTTILLAGGMFFEGRRHRVF